MDEQNARLLQQREAAVLRFIDITSAEREDAVGIMRRYAFDVEEAVDAYLQGERCPVSLQEAAPPGEATSSNVTAPPDLIEPPKPITQVDRILNSAEKIDPEGSSPAPLFGGAGNSLSAASSSSGRDRRLVGNEPDPVAVHITFYGNGFTVLEGAEPSTSRSSSSSGPPVANRRTGLATLSEFGGTQTSDEFTGALPLRSFDDAAGREFMREVENSRVPQELRRTDPTTRQPVPVSITLHDRRPKNYRCTPDTSFKAFSGSGGQALGAASNNYVRLEDAAPQTTILQSFLRSFRTCTRSLLNLGPKTPQRPAVRSGAPETKLQIRLGSGQRIQVVLNNDSPISDLFSAIEFEMYEQWRTITGGADSSWTCPPFDLVAGYPPQPLSSERSTTLEAHVPSLLGVVVTQRMHP